MKYNSFNQKSLDDVIFNALKRKKKVELFLCNDEEGDFGLKIDGNKIFRNLPWEVFEIVIEDEKELDLYDKFMKQSTSPSKTKSKEKKQ